MTPAARCSLFACVSYCILLVSPSRSYYGSLAPSRLLTDLWIGDSTTGFDRVRGLHTARPRLTQFGPFLTVCVLRSSYLSRRSSSSKGNAELPSSGLGTGPCDRRLTGKGQRVFSWLLGSSVWSHGSLFTRATWSLTVDPQPGRKTPHVLALVAKTRILTPRTTGYFLSWAVMACRVTIFSLYVIRPQLNSLSEDAALLSTMACR